MSAREDYQYGERGAQHYTMCDEIDRLRLENAWLRRIADDRGEENERLRSMLPKPTIPANSQMLTVAEIQRMVEAGEITFERPT